MTRRDLLTRFLQGLLALPFLTGLKGKESTDRVELFVSKPKDEPFTFREGYDALQAQKNAGGLMPYSQLPEGTYSISIKGGPWSEPVPLPMSGNITLPGDDPIRIRWCEAGLEEQVSIPRMVMKPEYWKGTYYSLE